MSILPEDFRFGVATAGFQVEGGFNGPGQPRNNWARWEDSGRVRRSGEAVDAWRRFEHHLERAAGIGCNAFSLSVEWARCEPKEGEFDEDAFRRYLEMLKACRSRDVEPVLALHHFTHPEWLGEDFWLRPESPQRFAAWVEAAASRLATGVRQWITLDELNTYALSSFLIGEMPPGRKGHWRATMRVLDHLLAAHVLAYDRLHNIQPEAVVGINPAVLEVYELHRLLMDVLCSRSHGVDPDGLDGWLAQRRRGHDERFPAPTRREALLRRVVAGGRPSASRLPEAVKAVYTSPHERCLDVSQIDYYDPLMSSQVCLPGTRTAGGRNWSFSRPRWDVPARPEGLLSACEAGLEPGTEIWIVENGLASRGKGGRDLGRIDGWDRVRYLREHLRAVVAAVDSGVPLTGYYHWTLGDNYEWGSYEPHFGLYRVNHQNGGGWSDTDSMGKDAAGAYRRLIEGLRAGERSVLDAPLP